MLVQAVKFKLTGSAAKDRFPTGFGASFLGDPARVEGAVGDDWASQPRTQAPRSNYGVSSVVIQAPGSSFRGRKQQIVDIGLFCPQKLYCELRRLGMTNCGLYGRGGARNGFRQHAVCDLSGRRDFGDCPMGF